MKFIISFVDVGYINLIVYYGHQHWIFVSYESIAIFFQFYFSQYCQKTWISCILINWLNELFHPSLKLFVQWDLGIVWHLTFKREGS
jgi:hypothetical protein